MVALSHLRLRTAVLFDLSIVPMQVGGLLLLLYFNALSVITALAVIGGACCDRLPGLVYRKRLSDALCAAQHKDRLQAELVAGQMGVDESLCGPQRSVRFAVDSPGDPRGSRRRNPGRLQYCDRSTEDVRQRSVQLCLSAIGERV